MTRDGVYSAERNQSLGMEGQGRVLNVARRAVDALECRRWKQMQPLRLLIAASRRWSTTDTGSPLLARTLELDKVEISLAENVTSRCPIDVFVTDW